jgi:hypothetical protein
MLENKALYKILEEEKVQCKREGLYNWEMVRKMMVKGIQ